jgi:hypothetical protein
MFTTDAGGEVVLKRANNVQCHWDLDGPGLLLGAKGRLVLQIGNRKVPSKFRLTKAQVREKKARSEARPEPYLKVGSLSYWRFKDKWYVDDDDLAIDAVEALIKSYDLQLKKKVSEAKTATAANRVPDGGLREFIPSEIRLAVWERDSGSCRSCGSTTELQYDHVIPVSMGGASTTENLQVLCGNCNRRKGASV